MYAVDDLDRVVSLAGLPEWSIGTPFPVVLADDFRMVLAYRLADPAEGVPVRRPREVTPDDADCPTAIIMFVGCVAHMLGPPNDEAFNGHPLYERGLLPYGAFEIKGSSWVRTLRRMNAVHPRHLDSMYDDCRHFVLAFKENTFECIANGFRVEVHDGSVRETVEAIRDRSLQDGETPHGILRRAFKKLLGRQS